jgi:hypothetical protein
MKISDLHSEIQAGILDYLSNHPSASASLQVIHSDWLANERVPHNIEQVQTALNRLVDHGELKRCPNTDIYSL